MTTSAYTSILRAVQGVILSLNLQGAPDVKRRKHPLVSGDDVLPIILVTPETEKSSEENVENSIFIQYPVRVTITFPGNMLLESDVDKLLDWRQSIRQALHKVALVGAPSVFDCDIEPNPPFDQQFYQANYDKSSIRFFFKSSELRAV